METFQTKSQLWRVKIVPLSSVAFQWILGKDYYQTLTCNKAINWTRNTLNCNYVIYKRIGLKLVHCNLIIYDSMTQYTIAFFIKSPTTCVQWFSYKIFFMMLRPLLVICAILAISEAGFFYPMSRSPWEFSNTDATDSNKV